jgi:hypothetical protein
MYVTAKTGKHMDSGEKPDPSENRSGYAESSERLTSRDS